MVNTTNSYSSSNLRNSFRVNQSMQSNQYQPQQQAAQQPIQSIPSISSRGCASGSAADGYYDNPHNMIRNTNSASNTNPKNSRIQLQSSNRTGGVENFENLYSKVSVPSGLKLAWSASSSNRTNNTLSNQYVPPPSNCSKPSSLHSSQLRYDDDQPAYINSNFENDI